MWNVGLCEEWVRSGEAKDVKGLTYYSPYAFPIIQVYPSQQVTTPSVQVEFTVDGVTRRRGGNGWKFGSPIVAAAHSNILRGLRSTVRDQVGYSRAYDGRSAHLS